MWPLFYLDGLFVFTISLGSLLGILVSYLLILYFPDGLPPHSRLVGMSVGMFVGTMIYGCILPLWYFVGVLVRALLLMLTDLTCSRTRSDELEYESGHGSVRCGFWMTTDLVHPLPSNTVGTDLSLCLLARLNLYCFV
jgi:hypothetical protein